MNIRSSFAIFFSLILLAGCVSLPVEEETFSRERLPEPERSMGVYHKVNKGETLWRIARTYDVPVVDIVNSNNIPNVAQIEENQLIFIPGIHQLRSVVIGTDEKDDSFIWPVKGEVTGYYRQRKNEAINKGIDIKVAQGTTVKAARTGRVVFADELPGYGKTVILAHSGGFHTVYAQNSELLVRLDEQVLKNSPIARVGHVRNLAHLHFQVRKDGIENNPLHFLP